MLRFLISLPTCRITAALGILSTIAWAIVGIAGIAPAAMAQSQPAVQFDGVNDYVTFGAAPSLGATTFTIEVRFKRTATGVGTSTGTGGLASAVPLLTKGRGEAETPANLNMNYFLGINTANNALCADFEDALNGGNHPVIGTTPITNNVWHHAAATYDGTTWRLYLDGNLEATLVVNQTPEATSIQHAALGSALTSNGTAAGFFAGILDEARIWSVARAQSAIQTNMDLEALSGTGLIARWGLNEGAGTSVGNSIAGGVAGTLTNGPAWSTDSPIELAPTGGLRFDGTNGYVTFGNPASLQLTAFTIEMWIRRDGAGVGTNTGNGGIPDAIPLVAKGRAESETATTDINYLFGIRASDGVLCGDFEEGQAGASPSINHPVAGVTPIGNGVWHHVAATYDGTTWKLYLDGGLDGQLAVGQPLASASTVAVSLASALLSTNVPAGFFNGAIDEVRIWSVARTQAEIQTSMNLEIGLPTTGLVARWALDEDAQTTVSSTAGATLPGTVTGTGWAWAGPGSFNAVVSSPPNPPTSLSATPVGTSQVDLAWTDASTNETGFEIERSTTGSGGPFTPLATVAANTVVYSNNGLSASSQYCYRVHAVNGGGPSGYAGPQCATTAAAPNGALDFGGTNGYVSFGNPAALHLTAFTIEMWMRRDGAGVGTDTGTNGIPDAIPLLTRGRAESEAAAVDINYFLGIKASSGVLCADFEEGASGAAPSGNHPILGATAIGTAVWHHVAATYDGTTWKLYLDGALDAQLAVGQPVAAASDVAVALASALNSTNVASGFFDGVVDEVRVWNTARSAAEIQTTINSQLTSPVTGLVARWGLNEGTGTAVNGSAGTTVNGSIVGSNFTWAAGTPFNLSFNLAPAAPAVIVPANNATGVSTGPSLYVSAADPDGGNLTVTWYGRPLTGGAPGPDFTIIGNPDTQYYTGQLNGGSNAILKSINNWIVANRVSRNIAYIATLGDCVEHGDAGDGVTPNIEWMRADTSYARIENPGTTGMPDGIPYGITVGNHDQSPNGDANGTTTFYNQYFGVSRFQGRGYYGGHYGTNNDNWYDFFSASGMDFIVISMEYDTTPDQVVLDWADQLLTTYANRRAIVITHNMINTGNPATFSGQGQAIYNALRGHSNLFLLLGGHVPGEGRRQDTFNGVTVNSLLADYQSRTNGGTGWTRIMEFSPANNVIRVRTYSPWLDQFEADADSSSQFTLSYNMTSLASFQQLGTGSVPSGGNVSLVWPGLWPNTAYEWYATVSDGSVTTTGPTWKFTTSGTVGVESGLPGEIALAPIAPNPAHGRAQLSFALPGSTPVRLSVLDIQGREVAVLVDGVRDGGRHSIEWDGRTTSGSLGAGLYLVRLKTPGATQVRKMVWAR